MSSVALRTLVKDAGMNVAAILISNPS